MTTRANEAILERLAALEAIVHNTRSELEETRQELIDTRAQLNAVREGTPVSVPFSSTAPRNLEPKVAQPDKFDGDRKKYRDFKVAVETIFYLQPLRYTSSRQKTGYIGTLLTGTALSWYRSYFEARDLILDDYDRFMNVFADTFSDPNVVRNAQRELRTLTQGRRPASTYVAEFRRVALDTGYDETAKLEHFRHGLHDDIKDALARIDAPTRFDDFITLVIKIDNRLYERCVERQAKSHPTAFSDSGTSSSNKDSYKTSLRTSPNLPSTSPSYQPRPSPLQKVLTNAGTLTRKEKERRRAKGLCAYCGQADHTVENCPKKKEPSKGHKLNVVETTNATETSALNHPKV
jgi:hypothetical protein